MIELVILGASVGVLSGFFGIGGGTILVPSLLMIGYAIKEAIGISIVQMVFSSIYGSYLNNKKGNLDIKMVGIIGIGGSVGDFISGYTSAMLSNETLEIVFLFFASFALIKLFFKTKNIKEKEDVNLFVLFVFGLFLGILSMTIGVGGSIILVPILVSFWHIDLKKATSAGLFFVVFSSVSGMISHSMNGDVNFESGIVIGISSLIGVYIGINLKDKVDSVLQKKLLVSFYMLIVTYLIYRIFIDV